MECGPKILSAQSNSRFQTHLKNAANALCARTLPKQHRTDPAVVNTARHHTYPRTTPPKRAPLTCRMESILYDQPRDTKSQPARQEYTQHDVTDVHTPPNGVIKPKRTLAREVANAWESRVGKAHESAPAARVQSLFNDIELYPTKTQVFEMLVCARQCARRQSLSLTFGEFCVFAAELRKSSKQARLTPNKPESPIWSTDKESLNRNVNGSEPSPPPYEVFLGGSCNPTTWRSDIAIPMLNKMGITYFNPQVAVWSSELVEVEHRAKAAARALLFVLDSETRAVAACVEAAYLAAAPRNLLLVLRPYARNQMIGQETISDHEYVELSRARATLQEAVERRGLPAFTDIPAALRCARAVLRGARTHPRHSLGHTILRLKRTFDAAGGRNSRLPRSKAVDALRDVTRTNRETADQCLPAVDTVDFETFCGAVAELVSDSEANVDVESRSGGGLTERVRRVFRSLCEFWDHHLAHSDVEHNRSEEAVGVADAGGGHDAAERTDAPSTNGRVVYNARLKAYGRKLGLFIPKNGGRGTEAGSASSTLGSGESAESPKSAVFTPGTERRLERLPAMLGAPAHDVYLGGAFPSNEPRPEEILRRANVTYVIPRVNDYSRMFSAPTRRSAPVHPESPRRDKKPRSAHETTDEEVQLREKPSVLDTTDRLSASDFYTVTEDVTPQPFKGTYDEELLLGSGTLVFSMSAQAPCFATMVLAAHYLGLRPEATVLLVQPMDTTLAPSYSEIAVKDYNRGRTYLIDVARRSDVPVFDNVEDTMRHVLTRSTESTTPRHRDY